MNEEQMAEKLRIATNALLEIYISDPTQIQTDGYIEAFGMAEGALKKLGIESPIAEIERRKRDDR